MNDLATKFEEAIAEMAEAAVNAKVDSLNFDDEASTAIEEAAREFNFDNAIENALESYNFDDAIGEALRHYDFSDDAEEAIKEAAEKFDYDELLGERIDAVLDEKLPAAIERHFTKLLERPDFAEKLVSLLFDRAGA